MFTSHIQATTSNEVSVSLHECAFRGSIMKNLAFMRRYAHFLRTKGVTTECALKVKPDQSLTFQGLGFGSDTWMVFLFRSANRSYGLCPAGIPSHQVFHNGTRSMRFVLTFRT